MVVLFCSVPRAFLGRIQHGHHVHDMANLDRARKPYGERVKNWMNGEGREGPVRLSIHTRVQLFARQSISDIH